MLYLLLASGAASAGEDRVQLCHQHAEGVATIEVSSRAVPAHEAHGDHRVADEACGNEVDDDCDGSVDEGCECPCYANADLDALYERWLAWQANSDLVYAYYTCEESLTYISYANGGTFDSDVVELYFYGYSVDVDESGDWSSYLGGEGGFYGVSYDWNYPWGAGSERYCSSYSSEYAWDGSTTADTWGDPTFEYLTAAEAAACQALLLDWAQANDLACPTTTEHLSF